MALSVKEVVVGRCRRKGRVGRGAEGGVRRRSAKVLGGGVPNDLMWPSRMGRVGVRRGKGAA